MRWLVAIAIALGTIGVPGTARAQFICANFWAQQSGTFGDECGVTVTGDPTTPPPQGTAHGVTGFRITAGGGFTYAYSSTSQVARFDVQIVGVDPTEAVGFTLDGVAYPLDPSQLTNNPDVTTQPVYLSGSGRIRSMGPDGSVLVQIIAIGTVLFEVTVTGGSVIVYPVTNSFCQCGNGNKHFNEDCDDGDVVDGDGCSAMCEIEPGWMCTGNPSVCTAPDAAPMPDATPMPDAITDAAAGPDGAGPPDAGEPGVDGGGGCCDAGGGGPGYRAARDRGAARAAGACTIAVMRAGLILGVTLAVGCGGGGGSADGPPGGDDAPIAGDDAPGGGDWLIVAGNQIQHADGTRFHGRGANLHDERSCNACSYAPREADGLDRWADELIDGWGANFIRFLLSAKAAPFNQFEQQWMNLNDDPGYLADVIQNVEHMTAKPGVYVLVTLFADPTIKDNNGEFDSEWPSSLGDSKPRYVALAEAFHANPRVLFGLTNEPHTTIDHADELAAVYQDAAIAAIRAVEDAHGSRHHIIAVQAPVGYARDLAYFVDNPLPGDQIAYEIHPYNTAAELDALIVQPAQTLPILIGEYGPALAMTEADVMAMWTVAQANEVPYIAWNFHMRCPPNLLQDTASDGCGLAASTGYAWPRTAWGDLLHAHLATPW